MTKNRYSIAPTLDLGWVDPPPGFGAITDELVMSAYSAKQADIDFIRQAIHEAWDAYFTKLSPQKPKRIDPPAVRLTTGIVVGQDAIRDDMPFASYGVRKQSGMLFDLLKGALIANGQTVPPQRYIEVAVDFLLLPFGWSRTGETIKQAKRRFIAVNLFHELAHWRENDDHEDDNEYQEETTKEYAAEYLTNKHETRARRESYDLVMQWLGPQPIRDDTLKLLRSTYTLNSLRQGGTEVGRTWWSPPALAATGLITMLDWHALTVIVTEKDLPWFRIRRGNGTFNRHVTTVLPRFFKRFKKEE